MSGLRVEPPARKLLSERARRLVLPDAAVRRRDTAKRRAVLDWASELSSAWAGEPSATGGLAWPTLGPRVRRFTLEPAAVSDDCAPLLVFVNPGSGGRRGLQSRLAAAQACRRPPRRGDGEVEAEFVRRCAVLLQPVCLGPLP